MLNSWIGKILWVDLSSREVSSIDTSKYIPDFIGGKGIALKIAWENLKKGIGPFDPDNILIFMTGPLTGTLAPTSGRGIVMSISPRIYPNPWLTRSSIGGFWAPELKYAGYDGLALTGKSIEPSYLFIKNSKVIIENARDLWGKGAVNTQRIIKAKHGNDVQVLCIGQAGENLIRSATIQHNLGNASGEAGFGSVMGSKNLKAIVIRGTGGVNIAKPKVFLRECMEAIEKVKNGPNITSIINSDVYLQSTVNCSSACPCNCSWTKGRKNIPAKIGPGNLNAVTQCMDYNFNGKLNITEYNRPEIPDIKLSALPGFGNAIDIHCLLNDLGISEKEYMSFYPWFDVFIQDGIKEVKGFKLDIDSQEFWFNFFKMIAYREGVGDIFAEGIIRTADRLGDLGIPEKLWSKLKRVAHFLYPAYGCSSHRLGRALESQPSPIWIFSMLHWAFDSRDPMSSHHQSSFITLLFPPHHGMPIPVADVPTKKIEKVYRKLFGNGNVIKPGFKPIIDKVKAAIWFQHRSSIKDSLLLCDWVFPRTFGSFKNQKELDKTDDLSGDVDIESRLFSSATGIKMSSKDLEKCGERIYNLDRILQIRNYNRDRKIDESIEWICEFPEKTDGTKLDKSMFKKYLDSYYKIRGWDIINGFPTKKKLKELHLNDISVVLNNKYKD